MKNVEFGEEGLSDLSKIADELFSDENDPRSISYVRHLNRPQVKWSRICLSVILPFLFVTGLFTVMRHVGISTGFSIAVCLTVLFLYIILSLKRIALCLISIYQRYAPDSIRNKCRFEPSCSEYMRLAITKYGFIQGLVKGVGRLKRCNIDHGGYDYP